MIDVVHVQAEVLAVASDLDRLNMRWAADRLRASLGRPPDERPCRVQDRSPGGVSAIPWGLAKLLYPAYGHGETLERLHERGGFGRGELGQLAVDAYGGERSYDRHGRLPRWPLLDLYDMARRADA